MSEANREGFTKLVNWGQAVHLEVLIHEGGLSDLVDRIREVFGTSYGSRNTFRTLFEMEDVPTTDKHRERAWLLLVALGQHPSAWGMEDFEPPPAWDREALETLSREMLDYAA